MEEESETDARMASGGAAGDASQSLQSGEADSDIGLDSKSDKGESNCIKDRLTANTSCYGKQVSSSEAAGENRNGVEDVEIGVKNLEASRDLSPSGKKEQETTEHHEKRVRLSPVDHKQFEGGGDTGVPSEVKMCIDSEDAVLNLDEVVERGSSPVAGCSRVQVRTVLSSSPVGSSEDRKKSDKKSDTCEGSVAGAGGLSGSGIPTTENGSAGSGGEESKAVEPEDLSSISEDLTDSDDDDDEGAGVVNSRLLTARQRGVLQRRRLIARRMGRRHQLSSSSDSHGDLDSDDNDGGGRDDNNQTGKESDNDEEVLRVIQGVLDKPVPRPNWFALQELRKREYCSAARLSTSWFREGVQSSLHMVKRLVTVERMKAHEGCVNALSFNRIGEFYLIKLRVRIFVWNTYNFFFLISCQVWSYFIIFFSLSPVGMLCMFDRG